MNSHDNNLSIADFRCVFCDSERLVSLGGDGKSCRCEQCMSSFRNVLGVPYFGAFESDDILGLIEIAANICNRGNFGITPQIVERWENILSAYDQSPDKAAFSKTIPETQLPYFPNRYNEWLEITRLTADLDLRGMKVLDMGAGLGFDSYRLARRGACVTALEYSPLLAEWGHQQFPGMRWVGGFSHCLPFRNGSFDAVFCNAALHHMKDIPAAISEALRVLRPGGYLITTCDSFRASDSDENTELESFDHQEAVLMGVNERVPKFSEFVEPILHHPELLDIEIYTHLLCNPLTGEQFSEIRRWVLSDDGEMLSHSAGSLAMRIKLKAPWPEKARCQKNTVLDPGEYASWLTDASSAVAKLSPLIPEQYVNTPLVGSPSTKFELLNGWRLQKPLQMFRTAYRRGRWFLRRSEAERVLSFEMALPFSSANDEDSILILVDDMVYSEHRVQRLAWTEVQIDLSLIPAGKVFAVEVRKKSGADTLAEACFLVRNRRLISLEKIAVIFPVPSYPRVYAVVPVFNRLHFTRQCINRLKSQTYPALTIIIADGGSTDGTVETIRSEHPDVIVLTSDKELWWTGSMAMGIEYALQNSSRTDDYVLMMNNDVTIPKDYISTLVFSSQCYNAAVGAVVCNDENQRIVLHPGAYLDSFDYIDYSSFFFGTDTDNVYGNVSFKIIDYLPGRSALIPIQMIRYAGSLDTQLTPDFLAHFEFYRRLKEKGCLLGICHETHITIDTAITALSERDIRARFVRGCHNFFTYQSLRFMMSHWRFMRTHAPDNKRMVIQKQILRFFIKHLLLDTPLRPLYRPAKYVVGLCRRIRTAICGRLILNGQRFVIG